MISVNHLTKYYGEHLAVDDISFEIESGHVYGFLGPNGAGKSTTMNIMTGCLSATSGTVLIDGHDIFEEPYAAKACIGYLPENPPLYMNDSVLEYLSFVAEAKGLRGEERWNQIQEVIRKTGISNVQHRVISQLSKGYRQRIGIAQALLGNPKVIILDEPTVGLDPIQIIEIRDLIRELGATHTVILSSHILSEVQAICDQIVMISRGRLVALGSPETLQQQLHSSHEISLTTDAPAQELARLMGGISHIRDLDIQESGSHTHARLYSVCEDPYTASKAIFQSLSQSPWSLLEMGLKRGNLEDVFLELSGDDAYDPEFDNTGNQEEDVQ